MSNLHIVIFLAIVFSVSADPKPEPDRFQEKFQDIARMFNRWTNEMKMDMEEVLLDGEDANSTIRKSVIDSFNRIRGNVGRQFNVLRNMAKLAKKRGPDFEDAILEKMEDFRMQVKEAMMDIEVSIDQAIELKTDNEDSWWEKFEDILQHAAEDTDINFGRWSLASMEKQKELRDAQKS